MGEIRSLIFKNDGYTYSISPSYGDSKNSYAFSASSEKKPIKEITGILDAKENDLQGAIDEAILTVAEANLLSTD